MATDVNFTGRQSDFLFKDEATYGVAPSGNYQRQPLYSFELAPNKPREANTIIGIPGATARDPASSAPGLYEMSGGLSVPLCLNNIGFWLQLAFGSPVTTGSASDYQHVFTSGAAVLPTRTIEVKKAPNKFDQDSGLAANSIRFAMAKEAGNRRVELDLIGRKRTSLSVSGGGAPVAPPALIQIPAAQGIVRWNDVVAGKALSADLTYTTGVSAERYLDGAADQDKISAIAAGDETSGTGSINFRGANATLDADAQSETPRELELEYQISATRTLILTMPRVFLGLSGAPITGAGLTEQTFTFRAEQTDTLPMLTVMLKNAVASY